MACRQLSLVGQLYLTKSALKKHWNWRSEAARGGHWGTTRPDFIYVHLNRVSERDLDMFYVPVPVTAVRHWSGQHLPGGHYSEIYSDVSRRGRVDTLFTQFSFPRGSRHVARDAGSSTKGELGYSLNHAFGAAFEIPVSSSPASSATERPETGPWRTAWQLQQVPHPSPTGQCCRSCT